MTTPIRDATVAFGAGYGALVVPIERRIVQYLQRNCYTSLIGDATLLPLRSTTSRALHDEIMAIGGPFHLVLTDLGEGDIMESFLKDCKHVVSCSIHAPNITRIGFCFLNGCTSLSSFDTSGLTSVTTIGDAFLGHITKPPTNSAFLPRSNRVIAAQDLGRRHQMMAERRVIKKKQRFPWWMYLALIL